jgi:hypothetical protein
MDRVGVDEDMVGVVSVATILRRGSRWLYTDHEARRNTRSHNTRPADKVHEFEVLTTYK